MTCHKKICKCKKNSFINIGKDEETIMYQGFTSSIIFKITQSKLSFCLPTHLVSLLGKRSVISWYNTSTHMDHPHDIHLMETKRILNFVQGTRTHGFHYVAQSSLELVDFIDSNWACDNIDRKSTSRYVFMLADGPRSWSSKNQSATALSSTEAEYRGVVNGATQCLWLHGILGEFMIEYGNSIVIYYYKKKYHSNLN